MIPTLFFGGTDVQRSLNHDDSKCINLYATTNDDGSIKAFVNTPGLTLYASIPAGAIASGIYTASNGRCFMVAGTILYEITTGGTLTNRGTITAGTISRMSDNGIEMIIVNGTDGWIYKFQGDALKKLTVATGEFTVTIASPAVFTHANHGLVAGDGLKLSSTTSTVKSDSLLTSIAASPTIATGANPREIVTSPDGEFVYALNTFTAGGFAIGHDCISQFVRNATTGRLDPLSPNTINILTGAIVADLQTYSPHWGYATATYNDMKISPDGNFVHVLFTAYNNGYYGGIFSTVEYHAAFSRNATDGKLTLSSFASHVGSVYNSIAISSDGLCAFITNTAANTISQFSRSTTTGVLTPLAGADATVSGVSVTKIISTPDSTANTGNVYALSNANLIRQYVLAAGKLTTPTTANTGTWPMDIVLSADNKSAYVTNYTDNTISQYSRNITTGALTPLTSAATVTLPPGTGPTSLVIAPDGASVYATNYVSNSVTQLSRDTTTFLLSSTTVAIATTSTNPFGIIITPDGKNVYITNFNGSTISAFSRTPSTPVVGLPTGLTTTDTYYVIATGLTANTFEVTATSATSATFTVNISTPNPATFTCANHGLHIGDTITLTTTGALPTGLATGTIYYVISTGFTTGAFQLSTTASGSGVITSGSQSGVHTFAGGVVNTSGVQAGTHTYTSIGYGFPNGCTTVSYVDGRFVACQPLSQNFYVSNVLSGGIWNTLNVQTADSNPDYVVGQIVSHNELIIFCEQSGETFYDSGTYPSPLVRNLSGVFEAGCISPYSIAKIDNSVMWLGKSTTGQGVIYRLQGYTPVRISSYSIEYAMQQMTTVSDARAFTYQQDGHHFYVISFPSGNKTFVFDANTQLWHERANFSAGVFSRWEAQEYAYFDGKHLVCDYSEGKIYSIDLNAYTYGAEARKWVRSFRVPINNMKRVIHHRLTLEAEMGVGVVSGPTPTVMIKYSNDGGHTWSADNWRDLGIGSIGEYAKRVFWTRLGMTSGQPRLYELSGTSATKTTLLNVFLE